MSLTWTQIAVALSGSSYKKARTEANKTELPPSPESDSVFKAVTQLQRPRLEANGLHLTIVVGMAEPAELREEQQPVAEYALSPVRAVADEAGGER
jgi:hypothetical protein